MKTKFLTQATIHNTYLVLSVSLSFAVGVIIGAHSKARNSFDEEYIFKSFTWRLFLFNIIFRFDGSSIVNLTWFPHNSSGLTSKTKKTQSWVTTSCSSRSRASGSVANTGCTRTRTGRQTRGFGSSSRCKRSSRVDQQAVELVTATARATTPSTAPTTTTRGTVETMDRSNKK